MASVTQHPLRILCIHGYRQDGRSFREKTGALRKLLKKQVELVYMTAPHHVTQVCSAGGGSESGASEDQDSRGWWFSDPQARSFSAQQKCPESLGLDDSVAAVRAAAEELGPFDGVLGFSQGAALVAMLCALQEQHPRDPQLGFRFAILVAGFRSACEEHRGFYGTPLSIPSLHVFGLDDRVISDAMSRELLPAFLDPEVMTHPGGHFVPAASAHRQTYKDFLSRFQ
ncbi:hypothetical protein NHX12_010420 [Muraenolepis orangiensis]|uniref:Esterase OVCA2 n=1 Tax=Muraenolepis orangiensis TaxID=630683 RepID=A0A9Q0DJ27_9TELE|nr:hypothetical protein NHX12_010420 [Muraenolepis orangiensis]